jgi:hypothetical protein
MLKRDYSSHVCMKFVTTTVGSFCDHFISSFAPNIFGHLILRWFHMDCFALNNLKTMVLEIHMRCLYRATHAGVVESVNIYIIAIKAIHSSMYASRIRLA